MTVIDFYELLDRVPDLTDEQIDNLMARITTEKDIRLQRELRAKTSAERADWWTR